MTAFRSVVLDVDSTVSAIEGIDWLAAERTPEVARLVEQLTADAMDSKVPLDEVYGRRLAIIRPTRDELRALSDAYIAALLPGVREAIAAWQRRDVTVVLVSGGLRDALLPLSRALALPPSCVFAVDLQYDDAGVATGVATDAPLARSGGKPLVVQSLALPRPILAVGDGSTDAELSSIVDRFMAFTGVARRPAVVARANGEVATFRELTDIVLGDHNAD